MIEVIESYLHELIKRKCVKYAIGIPKETAPGSKKYTVAGNLAISVHTLKEPVKFKTRAPEVLGEGIKGDKLIYNHSGKFFFVIPIDQWNDSDLPNSPKLK